MEKTQADWGTSLPVSKTVLHKHMQLFSSECEVDADTEGVSSFALFDCKFS